MKIVYSVQMLNQTYLIFSVHNMLKNTGDASNLGQLFRCILSDLVFNWKQGTRLFQPRFVLIESSQLFKHEKKVTVSPKVKLAQHIHVVVKWSII